MPELIIPPGFAQCQVMWTFTGDPEPVMCTLGVRLNAGITDPVAVANELWDDWTGNLTAATLSNGYTLFGVRCRMGSDGGDGPTGEHLENQVGTRVSTSLPSNSAGLVRKVTALGGRRNRGRLYLPAGYVPNGELAINGNWAGANFNLVSAGIAGLVGSIEGGVTYDAPVIFHSAAPTTPTIVTQLVLQAKIATQRTRMRP